MGKALNLVGLRFGRLVVIKRAGADEHKRVRWLCRCDCGNKVERDTRALRSQGVVSCGCHRRLKSMRNLLETPTDEKLGQIGGTNLSRLRSSAPQKNNQLGVRGVVLLPSGRYLAYVYHKGKRIDAGTHGTLADAQNAVAVLRTQLLSEYGKNNQNEKKE